MPALAWIAHAVFIIAAVGGAAFALVRGLRAWRAFRRIQRTIGARMLNVARGIQGAESRLAAAGDAAVRLDRATAALRESVATLSLLTAAAGDARGALRVLAFLRR